MFFSDSVFITDPESAVCPKNKLENIKSSEDEDDEDDGANQSSDYVQRHKIKTE